MTANLESGESLIEKHLNELLRSLDGGTRTMNLVQTLVLKSSSAPSSSAISPRLLFELQTVLTSLNAKFASLQFLARSSPPSQTSSISEKSGKETQKKKGF